MRRKGRALSFLKIEKYQKEKTQNKSGPIVVHFSQQGRKWGFNKNHQQLLMGWDGRRTRGWRQDTVTVRLPAARFGLSGDEHCYRSKARLYLEDLTIIYSPRPPEELCRSTTWWADCDYLLRVHGYSGNQFSNGPEVLQGSWSCADTLKLCITWRANKKAKCSLPMYFSWNKTYCYFHTSIECHYLRTAVCRSTRISLQHSWFLS